MGRLMKVTTIPPLCVSPKLRRQAESVLDPGGSALRWRLTDPRAALSAQDQSAGDGMRMVTEVRSDNSVGAVPISPGAIERSGSLEEAVGQPLAAGACASVQRARTACSGAVPDDNDFIVDTSRMGRESRRKGPEPAQAPNGIRMCPAPERPASASRVSWRLCRRLIAPAC